MDFVKSRGTLKRSIEYFGRTKLRARTAISLVTITVGMIFLVLFVLAVIAHESGLDSWLFAVAGVVLLVIGLALFVTDRLEALLSGGQTALVDGLQAG